VNLAAGLFSMIAVGTGVKVAQSFGAGDENKAKIYIQNGFFLSILLGIFYSICILSFKDELIGFFELNNPEVEKMAAQYLLIAMIGTIFTFFNTLFSMILNSMGNSGRPFHVNMIGFLINIVLDPLFIFGFANFSGWGVQGAALATLFSNLVVSILFIIHTRPLELFTKHIVIKGKEIKDVIKLGIPITVQRVSFSIISIIIAKIIIQWGAEAIAVQRVGIQIESISYMTMGGLQAAVSAFIGQNFGADLFNRIREGYKKALILTMSFGIVISIVLIMFPRILFSVFLQDPDSLRLGIDYLRILGFSQMFMCMEIMTVGAFNGIGKTYIPPLFNITLTALRIPLALFLSGIFGLNGVWMAISLSSIFKGIVLVLWFNRSVKKIGNIVPVEGR
jgi:putative MATE family efflux protein